MGNLNKSREEEIKFRDQEAENYGKMLKNMTEEQEKVKKRLFQVQDHKYIINLRAKIQQSKQMIQELESKNLSEKNNQFSKEK